MLSSQTLVISGKLECISRDGDFKSYMCVAITTNCAVLHSVSLYTWPVRRLIAIAKPGVLCL